MQKQKPIQMKQYTIFRKKLHDLGYHLITSWQTHVNKKLIEHVTIKSNIGFVSAIFFIYGETEGFSMFIQSPSNSMDDDITLIQGIID